MSDEPPGFNAPRRKARFRSAHDDPGYRRPSVPRPVGDEPPADEPAMAEHDPVPGATGGEAAEDTSPVVVTTPVGEQNNLLPNFRLNKVYEERPTQTNPFKDWRWLLLTFLLAGLGVGGGYALARLNSPPLPLPSATSTREPGKLLIDHLTAPVLAQVDAAFAAMKQAHYQAAREQFAALREQHPEWWSMTIESARSLLYLHDGLEAQHTLRTLSTPQALPDADFIQGLLHLTNKELALAEQSLAQAVARNPARPDFFFFWGECLRRDGKPLEAASRFRSALLRNQYEYAEGLYQLKLWLSQIQADEEQTSGANKEIDAALALPRPSYQALFAAAARELKAKHPKEAAGFMARAQTITEPAVFQVILQDPTFLEQSDLPELAPFYK